MNFLLFLTILWMQHICSKCDSSNHFKYPTENPVECDDVNKCTTLKKGDRSYTFAKEELACEAEQGSDKNHCFINKDACKRHGSAREVLLNGNTPVICTTNDDCGKGKKYADAGAAAKEYTCESSLCCSKEVIQETKCPLNENEERVEQSCAVGECSQEHHCSTVGCCKNHYCEGGPYLPLFSVSNEKRMKFKECSSYRECSSMEYRDSYCSYIEGNKNGRFCCPVPFAKSFLEESASRFLIPSKILTHHSIQHDPKTLGEKLSDEHKSGHFSKNCVKNGDCDEDEFCDNVVTKDETSQKNFALLKDYKPMMCFPAPRCAGRIVKYKETTGIKKCKYSTECASNEYCDTMSNDGSSKLDAMKSLGVCCQYDCTEEAKATGKMADESIKAYATLTDMNSICSNNNDCGENGLCISPSGSMVTKARAEFESLLPKPYSNMKLCCKYNAKEASEMYRCEYGNPLKDSNDKILICGTDEDCNKVEGQPLSNSSLDVCSCVRSTSNENHCCQVAICDDEATFMRTELECNEAKDCMKDEEDKSDAEQRAVCVPYHEKEQDTKKKKCCPLGKDGNPLPYCTRTTCSALKNCAGVGVYCHPTKHVCCYLGKQKLDGSKHEKGGTCQDTCPDINKFGTMIPQYCVKEKSNVDVGTCYVTPYVRVKDRERTVNPVYKTVCIVCVVLTLVFAFLAVIMFVNYRSRNFCDKYRPKRKGKKDKKSKKKKGKSGATGSESGTGTSTGTGADGTSTGGGGGTTGGTSGTSGAGGTTGNDGTSGAGDGTSGTGA